MSFYVEVAPKFFLINEHSFFTFSERSKNALIFQAFRGMQFNRLKRNFLHYLAYNLQHVYSHIEYPPITSSFRGLRTFNLCFSSSLKKVMSRLKLHNEKLFLALLPANFPTRLLFLLLNQHTPPQLCKFEFYLVNEDNEIFFIARHGMYANERSKFNVLVTT